MITPQRKPTFHEALQELGRCLREFGRELSKATGHRLHWMLLDARDLIGQYGERVLLSAWVLVALVWVTLMSIFLCRLLTAPILEDRPHGRQPSSPPSPVSCGSGEGQTVPPLPLLCVRGQSHGEKAQGVHQGWQVCIQQDLL